MTTPEGLPFEFPFRWQNEDLTRMAGVSPEAAALLEQRDRGLEDYLAATTVPLIFHWPGTVANHVNVRNGPGEFRSNGTVHMIRYRWDTAPSSSSTVEWKLDGTTVATHTLPATTNPHIEYPAQLYSQEAIVAIVTTSGTSASGLTAFVYFGA